MFEFLSRRLVASFLLLGMLAACADLSGGATHKTSGFSLPAPTNTQSDTLLQYVDSVRKLSSAEQARELDKARLGYAQNSSDFNRIKLAWVLALPGTPFRDTSAALNLLNELPKAGSAGLHALAGLLQNELAERQRIAAASDEWAQKYKDEQKRADALQFQIDGIKRMEKNLMQRNKR